MRVRRWRKYGLDRLYVTDAAGRRVGWVDLPTGRTTIERPELTDAFTAAVTAHRTEHPGTEHLPAVAPPAADGDLQVPNCSPDPGLAPRAPAEPAERDLVANLPGQAARARADAELLALRSRNGRLGAFLARALDLNTDERNWRIGAAGEEAVGPRLDKLTRHGWHVLHSVPIGRRGSDIDHVLIGPAGVYTVNTKNHPGKSILITRTTIIVGRRPVPYLPKARHEATEAARLLSAAAGFPVTVKPVLVILTGTLIPDVTIVEPPDGVPILTRADLPGAFRRATTTLSSEQVELLHSHARKPATWAP